MWHQGPHPTQPTSSSLVHTHTHHPSRPPVPTAAPRNVAVHGATATQLDVTWEPPPLESQNGDIQGYKVGELPGPEGHRARWGWEGLRCGEREKSWVYTCPLGRLHPVHEMHAYMPLEQSCTHPLWHPRGRQCSEAGNSGCTPACTIPRQLPSHPAHWLLMSTRDPSKWFFGQP